MTNISNIIFNSTNNNTIFSNDNHHVIFDLTEPEYRFLLFILCVIGVTILYNALRCIIPCLPSCFELLKCTCDCCCKCFKCSSCCNSEEDIENNYKSLDNKT